jgi:pimeloyl-ACP methyl ester carboxylesterase
VTRFHAPDGTPIAYADEGAGLPVLCLPGLTRTMADFDLLVPHLPPAVRLIRMDYRGRGGSGWSAAARYTVAVEAGDALALLDHLGIAAAAVIGTSRGGLIGMFLAATARSRLRGLLLNDVGPVLERAGLERIAAYVGRNPAAATHADLAEALARQPGFSGVPAGRWLDEARRQARAGPRGLEITYDPALATAFRAALEPPAADLWPLFDACAGLPLALIRGAGSDLLSAATAAEMRRRRPDMIFAEVPGRGHVPFLDEPAAVAAVRAFLEACR